uniref:Uncharacterized protein n=1 Tax=viral metagenome TaxID=1070528 RepID=A0A6C0F6T7_9ZZZZ|tara:strand:- start:13053 stop:14291 length:1239 start_codon:yes stop_codon:yes gene_type:complete
MSLTKTSATFLKLFLPHINKINHQKDKNIDSIIKKNYTNIKLSLEYYNTIFKGKDINKNILRLNNENRDEVLENFSLLKNDTFVPNEIKNFIKKNIKCIETYNFIIKNIKFTIEFIVCDNKDHKIYLKKIIVLLHFLLSFFVPQISTLKISLCFTNKKKLIPEVKKQTLSKDNINTALTFACKKDGEILLYRKEEWYKVLIHELMHSLCFDFAQLSMSFSIKNLLKKMFSVNSEFHITETYSEFWANIFHTSIISFFSLSNKNDFEDFKLNFRILNEFEKYFSIFSCIKVLDHMGLSYEEITSGDEGKKSKSLSLYKESTNVFAYHILKSIWLFNTEDMLLWFNKHNTNLIFSKKEDNYVMDLLKKTQKYYIMKEYIKNIKFIEKLFYSIKDEGDYKELINSLRMTIVELKI